MDILPLDTTPSTDPVLHAAGTLSMYPVEDIPERGKAIDRYLEVSATHRGGIVYLPNMHFGAYQSFSGEVKPQRFIFNRQGFLWMLQREPVLTLVMETLLAKKITTLYSSKGTGKSFCLYLIACRLRTQRERYRVVYVNQCGLNFKEALVRNFLSTMYAQVDAPARQILLNLDRILNDLTASNETQERIFIKSLEHIEAYYMAMGVQLLFILDQTNIPFGYKPPTGDAVQNLLKLFKSGYFEHSRVLFSSSPNGELSLEPDASMLQIDALFRLEDLREFLRLYPGFRPMLTETQARVLLDVTEGYPLELDHVLSPRNPNNAPEAGLRFEDKIDRYEKDYVSRVAILHNNWLEKAPDTKKKALHETMATVLYALPRHPIRFFYDRRYLTDVHLPGGGVVLRAVSKLALEGMLSCYGPDNLMPPLAVAFRTVIAAHNVSRSMIGGAYESLIRYYYMSCGARVEWTLGSNTFAIIAESFDVTHMHGTVWNLDLGPLDLRGNHLILPESTSFPGYDMFFLHAEDKVLYAIQVTVSADLSRKIQMTRERGKASLNAWRAHLQGRGFALAELWFVPPPVSPKDVRLHKALNVVYPGGMHIPYLNENSMRQRLVSEDARAEQAMQAAPAAQGTRTPSKRPRTRSMRKA